MNAVDATVDLDDGDGLLAADRNGLLRAAAMAGAQVQNNSIAETAELRLASSGATNKSGATIRS